MKRNILIAILVIAVAGGFIGYRMYNEKTPTASEKAAALYAPVPVLIPGIFPRISPPQSRA